MVARNLGKEEKLMEDYALRLRQASARVVADYLKLGGELTEAKSVLGTTAFWQMVHGKLHWSRPKVTKLLAIARYRPFKKVHLHHLLPTSCDGLYALTTFTPYAFSRFLTAQGGDLSGCTKQEIVTLVGRSLGREIGGLSVRDQLVARTIDYVVLERSETNIESKQMVATWMEICDLVARLTDSEAK